MLSTTAMRSVPVKLPGMELNGSLLSCARKLVAISPYKTGLSPVRKCQRFVSAPNRAPHFASTGGVSERGSTVSETAARRRCVGGEPLDFRHVSADFGARQRTAGEQETDGENFPGEIRARDRPPGFIGQGKVGEHPFLVGQNAAQLVVP